MRALLVPMVVWLLAAPLGARTIEELAPRDVRQVRRLLRLGEFDKAERKAQQILERASRVDGEGSQAFTLALDLVVEVRVRRDDLVDDETLEMAWRVLRLQRAHLGPDAPQVADILEHIADLMLRREERDGVLAMYERVREIREANFHPEHVAMVSVLTRIANYYQVESRTALAESFAVRALDIGRRALGDDHLELADTLHLLSLIHADLGDYELALEERERSLRIRERDLGPAHQVTLGARNSVGYLLVSLGDYRGALDRFERSVTLARSSASASRHPIFARSLLGKGLVLRLLGDYREARRTLEESLAAMQRSVGPEHHYNAEILGALGVLHEGEGDYHTAVEKFARAVELASRFRGESHPSVALQLAHLGNALLRLGDHEGALEAHLRALEIRQQVYPEDHPMVGVSLAHVGNAYAAGGELERGAALLAEALRVLDAPSPEHPRLAKTLRAVGLLHERRGDLLDALEAFRRSAEIRETFWGADSPALAVSLVDVARVYAKLGQPSESMRDGLRAEAIARRHFRRTARGLSEREALRYAVERPSALDFLTTLAVGAADEDAPERERWALDTWDAWVRTRGVVLDEVTGRQRAAYRPDAPEDVRGLVTELVDVRSQLAALKNEGPERLPPERHRAVVNRLRLRKESLERDLAEAGHGSAEGRVLEQIGADEVVAALPTDAALVAYVRYGHHEPSPGSTAGGAALESATASWRLRTSYAAFVVSPGSPTPVVVPLGDAEEIERTVAAVRGAVTSKPPAKDEVYRGRAAGLYDLVWDPISSLLAGAERVFIIGAGALHEVDFVTLPVGEDDYLIDGDLAVHHLVAERDLPAVAALRSHGAGLLAMGDPAYASAAGGRTRSTPAAATSSSCRGPRGRHWSELSASAAEVDAVMDYASARGEGSLALTEEEATEGAFKQHAPGNRVLHLATHAFFDAERCGPFDSPLLRTGLVLAGANDRTSTDGAEDDGILTGEEVMAVDLSGVEWAVLSACDTGRGELVDREGVVGLQYAFRAAGVATVIMSLWPVQDTVARDWMSELYALRTEGASTMDAVRGASHGLLTDLRARNRDTNPAYWAGFIASGDWR